MINNLYFLLSIGGASVNVDLLQILADIFAKLAYAALGLYIFM
jgi:hypothetical protein